MTLHVSTNDDFRSDVNNVPMGVYFYYLNDRLTVNKNNFAPLGKSSVVLSAMWTPFLNEDNLDLNQIPYDQDYFGSIDGTNNTLKPECHVYRILNGGNSNFFLGNYRKYTPPTRKSTRYWENESKLFQYPYQYSTINDYANTPLKIVPHCVISDNIEVWCRQTLCETGSYGIYVKNYKGDLRGVTEQMQSITSQQLPVSSNQFAQFMAGSQASFLASNDIAKRNEDFAYIKNKKDFNMGLIGLASSGVDTAISANIGGIGGLFNQSVQTGYNYGMNEQRNDLDKQARIQTSLAQVTDLRNAPRSTTLGGGNVLVTKHLSNDKLKFIRYGLHEEYLDRLCDYFTLYGYKCNKLMNVNLWGRAFFTYVKTIETNIQADGMDKSTMDKIKSIYEKGIRFWNGESSMEIGTYSFDNWEVYE